MKAEISMKKREGPKVKIVLILLITNVEMHYFSADSHQFDPQEKKTKNHTKEMPRYV